MWPGAYIKITNHVRRYNHECGCGFEGVYYVYTRCVVDKQKTPIEYLIQPSTVPR